MYKEVENKKVISIRLSKEQLNMIDKLTKHLSNKNKIKYTRTMIIENCIAWQYNNEFNA